MTRSTGKLRSRISACLLLALAALASCGDDKAKIATVTPCHINSDCKDPLVCGLGSCHTACDSTRDCNETLGEHCLVTSRDDHVCASPADQKCTYNSECKAKDPLLICARDLHCRSECQTKDDCAKSQVCVMPDRLCADQSELTDGMLADLGGPGRDGEDGDASSQGGAGNAPGGEGGADNTPGSEGGNASGAVDMGGQAHGGSGGSAGTSMSGAGAGGAASGTECPLGTGDCDDNPDDCETDLTVSPNCGACNVECKPSHGPVLCDPDVLKCVINTQIGCDPGYADCNHDGKDGCESLSATDADNCGMCGHTCGGGKCAAGQCSAPIFLDPNKAPTSGVTYNQGGASFLVNDALLRQSSGGGTEIRRVDLPVTPASLAGSVLVSATSAIYGIGVDTNSVYFSIAGTPAAVLYKPLDATAGAAAKTAVTLATASPAYGMALAGGSIYLATYPGTNNFVSTIQSADLSVSNAVATPLPGLSDIPGMVGTVIVASGNLFWLARTNCNACAYVYRLDTAPIGGGTPVELSAGAYQQDTSIAADNTHVYWVELAGTTSKIRRVVSKGSPTPEKVEDVAVGLNTPALRLVVDTDYVYFQVGFQVFRVTKDGSLSPEPLANVTQAPNIYNLFAVDDKFVYGTGSGGQIVGVQKDALSK